MSLDEGQMLTWGPYRDDNTGNEFYGSWNMQQAKAIDPDLSDFPAFKWCAEKTTSGKSWYLPALLELYFLCDLWKDGLPSINAKLTAAGGTPISFDDHYWTSTIDYESPVENAVGFKFSDSKRTGDVFDKSTKLRVRAFAEINL